MKKDLAISIIAVFTLAYTGESLSQEGVGGSADAIPAANAPAEAASLDAKRAIADTKNFRIGDISFDAASASAAAALGIEPSAVSRPKTPGALAAGILSGIDLGGNFQSGFAIEAVPYILFGGDRLTYREYNENWRNRIAPNISTSVALAKGAIDDDSSARLSASVKWNVFDLGDPRKDAAYRDCLLKIELPNEESVFPTIADAPAGLSLEQQTEWLENELNKRLQSAAFKAAEKACRDPARQNLWNNSALDVAIAPVFQSEDGEIDDLSYQGLFFSSSLSYGFEQIAILKDSAQLVGNVQYASNEKIQEGEKNNFIERDRIQIGGRLIYGDPNKFFFGLELAWLNLDQKNERSSNDWKYAVGFDYRLREGIWLSLSTGTSTDRDDEQFALARVKFEFIENPSLGPLFRSIRDVGTSLPQN